MKNWKKFKNEITLFRQNGGVFRTREAIKAGIHPRTFYAMRDAGITERLNRGLYRLSNLPPLRNPDLVSVSLKIPKGIICLISALSFHEITTQIPHEIYIALERGTEPPRLDHPPIRLFWFKDKAFTKGIETYKVDNISMQVYCPEKTIADCFKYRNKIGLDTALEALKLYLKRRHPRVNDIIHYADICRVKNIIRPYMEAIL